jgi:hypothetical protein
LRRGKARGEKRQAAPTRRRLKGRLGGLRKQFLTKGSWKGIHNIGFAFIAT